MTTSEKPYSENFNLMEKLDTNKDGKLQKEELEKLGLEIQFSNLERGVIENFISTLNQQYQEFLKSIEEKKGYVFLLKDAEKILGKKTYETLINSGIPPKEFIIFAYELLKAEQEKDLLETATLVLTQDEIKELKELLLTKNYTQKQLQEFIYEQLNENISSAEMIKGTKLEQKLSKAGYNPYEFMKNTNEIALNYIEIENLSQDTNFNMSSGLIYAIIKLYNRGKLNTSLANLVDILKNKEGSLDKKSAIELKKLLEAIDKIKKAIKNLKLNQTTSENNEILMNPKLFGNLIVETLNNNLSIEKIGEKLKGAQKEQHAEYKKEEIINELKNDINQAGEKISIKEIQQLAPLQDLGRALKELKEKAKGIKQNIKDYLENNSDRILGLKETLEEFGIWKFLKDFISKIFKLLGFKNGWNSFEKKIVEKKYSGVIKYFEKTLSSPSKNSIFAEVLKDKNIQGIKPKNKLSIKAVEYLSSIGGKNINENLNNFFEIENFKKILEKSKIDEKEFKKNLFEIKKEKANGKEVNIAYIDFKYLSSILEKQLETEQKQDIKYISEKTGLPQDVIYGIWKNESSLKPAGTWITRFEEHKYKKFIKQGISSEKATMLATSYGVFQIMGFNYTLAGYNSVEEFVQAQHTKQGQIQAFINFINNPKNSKLKEAMINKNWDLIAKLYNGPAYKKNAYNTKLAQASNEYLSSIA